MFCFMMCLWQLDCGRACVSEWYGSCSLASVEWGVDWVLTGQWDDGSVNVGLLDVG